MLFRSILSTVPALMILSFCAIKPSVSPGFVAAETFDTAETLSEDCAVAHCVQPNKVIRISAGFTTSDLAAKIM